LRKEDRIRQILQQRGDQPGLVHIFSAMEPCPSYQPWCDKATGKVFLKSQSGKCVHYYFYFIDEVLGLCYLRIPTWAPFRLQFYSNGHSLLARQLDRDGIGYQKIDNAFVAIDNWERAQVLAQTIDVPALHVRLDHLAQTYCPILAQFPAGVHWSVLQVEYATDLVFGKPEVLGPLYEALSRTAI